MDVQHKLPSHIKKENNYYRYFCSNGRSFIFDKCDLPFFIQKTCIADVRGYVTTNRKKNMVSHMLIGAGKEDIVDHINGNPFDNRRSNLRIATPTQNHWNYRLSSRNSTGYKGIYRDNKTNGFHARICEHGRRHYLGLYQSAKAAALAYDSAARMYFGDYATLNFPIENEQPCIGNGGVPTEREMEGSFQ